MDGSGGLTISVVSGLSGVDPESWDRLGGVRDPFIRWDFLEALEASGCVGPRTGWTPRHLLAHDETGRLVGAMPLYLKDHSYGEYVFDHAWADALHRAGGRYYPKLQAAAPFTPVTGRRLLTDDPAIGDALVAGAVSLARDAGASSLHVTFCTETESLRLAKLGLLARTGVQFHWENAGYADFPAFLAALSANRRKTIRKERARACEGLTIRTLEGAEIDEAAWDVFFDCYMDTGARKWGQPYLNRAFFRLVGERMADRTVLFLAEADSAPVAAALNFKGPDTLYGRYWGRVGGEIPFLHFELCYYRAIEYAIAHGLTRVEAGAQGEHKLARGYAPRPTYSAHWIAHPGLSRAIADYLERERPAVAEEIEQLEAFTPFKAID